MVPAAGLAAAAHRLVLQFVVVQQQARAEAVRLALQRRPFVSFQLQFQCVCVGGSLGVPGRDEIRSDSVSDDGRIRIAKSASVHPKRREKKRTRKRGGERER